MTKLILTIALAYSAFSAQPPVITLVANAEGEIPAIAPLKH